MRFKVLEDNNIEYSLDPSDINSCDIVHINFYGLKYMVNENEQKTQKILQLQSKLAELQKEESEWIQRYRVLNGENEKLRRIIYNCYFDSDYLKNSEDVEEIIEYWEMRTAIERNHQE